MIQSLVYETMANIFYIFEPILQYWKTSKKIGLTKTFLFGFTLCQMSSSNQNIKCHY